MIAAPPPLYHVALSQLSAGIYPQETRAEASLPWREWLRLHFPFATRHPFADRHVTLWEWIEALEPDVAPPAFVQIAPRGGGKSSTAELGITRVGEQLTRHFGLFVSATQKQADKHVQAIATKFESLGMDRAVNRYGSSRGWRADLLRVANGYNVLALGLDAAGRGVKLDDYRPDFFCFDDVDERHDTPAAVERKIETITTSILPTGTPDAAVLFVQNRIHADSIASQLADGTADFLHNRTVHEEPAVRGLEYQSVEQPDGTRRYVVTGGTPTWEGQGIATVETQLNSWGRAAFEREAQHDVSQSEDGLWQRARDIDPYRVRSTDVPPLYRIAVGVDPNASEGNDEAGIVAAGIARRGATVHGYVLEDATVAGGPATWAKAAVACYLRWNADLLVAESNNGGEMVAITIGTVPDAPRVKLIHASRGKRTRAEPVQALYEEGRVHHAGVFLELERELCTWTPGDPSPNRLDALVWTITELMLAHSRPLPRPTTRTQMVV